MVELKNKIRILFSVSLMFLLAQAFEINLLNFLTDFKCKVNIKVHTTDDGNKEYFKLSLGPMYCWAANGTSTVIVYIVDETRFEEIANLNAFNVRMRIANELGQNNHEMIVLGIKNCQLDEFDLISKLIFDIIKPHLSQMSLRIVTMGEHCFSRTYFHDGIPFEKYQENRNIRCGALQRYLNKAFPKMEYRSNRPDPINIREVLFYENLEQSRPSYGKETRWPIFVENGEYLPAPNIVPYLSRMIYNFVKRYKDNKIHLLILSGEVYNQLISNNNLPWFEELMTIMSEMSRNNETLFMMGCFNFDWSEIDIVPQIIMKHSEIGPKNLYNVFTIGLGMFNTFFQNPYKDDKRVLSSTPNEKVIDFVKKYNGGSMKERTIEICDCDASDVTTIQIRLINGRYVPLKEFKDYCFSSERPNAKFAFIVIDSTEIHDQNVLVSVAQVNQHVGILKNDGIVVFVIKTINFELYDLHIIPEWIQWHRGAVHPDRIAVLGGGRFDTTFNYVSPQYEVTYTLLNMPDELKIIRKAFVDTAGNKGIIVANIDISNFAYWRFPMHTMNGFYEPVVLSASEMFRTENRIKILFLIMKADKFNQMATAYPASKPTLITDFREKIASHYPFHQWAVYLVGLDNFGVNDFHLFAEFVKTHTNDIRALQDFVFTFGDDIYQTEYKYRDTWPFYTANNIWMADAFTEFFSMVETFSNQEN